MGVKTGRILYFDILRVLACVLVVLLHSSSVYVTDNFGSLNFCVGNFLDSLSRVSVPVFVMISGAFILDEEYSFSNKKLASRIAKLVLFFAVWSALYGLAYNVIKPMLAGEGVDWGNTVYLLFKGHFHLWFIPMIIGLYLLSPLLRLWVKRENRRYVEFFLLLVVIFNFLLPQIINLGGIFAPETFRKIDEVVNIFDVKYVLGYVGYFVLGWYLRNVQFSKCKTNIIYLLGILGFLVTFVGTQVLAQFYGYKETFYQYSAVNVLLCSTALFVLIKNMFERRTFGNKFGSKVIKTVSDYSLGIYAIHAAVVSAVAEFLPKFGINNAFINIPVIFVSALAVSLLASFVLKRIPGFKKIV